MTVDEAVKTLLTLRKSDFLQKHGWKQTGDFWYHDDLGNQPFTMYFAVAIQKQVNDEKL